MVDVQKFVDDGVACQTLVLDCVQGLLGDSDDKARSCQSNLVQPPTSIEALAATDCFGDVVINVKSKLTKLVNPTIDCLKTANITVHNESIQHIFELTGEHIVSSVKSIIKIPGQTDQNSKKDKANDDNIEVTSQVESICDAVTPAFAEKVDMHKFFLNDCQLVVSIHLQYIVAASNEAIRKCQSDIVPAPKSIKAVTSTKCFDDIVNYINMKLPNMVDPTVECMKKANITVDNSFMHDMLLLTEKNVILSVLNIIKIPGQVDNIADVDDNEVENQFEYVAQIVMPALAGKIDMVKLLNGGADCRSFMANSIRALLWASDIAARKCQSDIVPAPTTVGAVTSTKCFGDVASNIKTRLTDLVKPTVDCLKKADINADNSVIQDMLQLAEKSVTDSVQNIIKLAARVDTITDVDDNEVEDQFVLVSQIVMRALAGKVDMLQLMNKGSDCRSLLANSIRALLGASDNAARKCQRDIVPEPKTVEAVTSTKCFESVATNVKQKLNDLVKPTADCLKKVDIIVDNSAIQEILQLAEKSIIASVKTVIKIASNGEKAVTNENDDDVKDQLEYVSQMLLTALAGKIDMLKLMNVGPECQSSLANSLRTLLGASDIAACSCQSSMIPAPTTIEAVITTKCFEDITTNVKAKLTELVKPAVECLKKADITVDDSVTQQTLQFAEKTVIEAVQNILYFAVKVDNIKVDNITNAMDSEVEDQFDYVSQVVVPVLIGKIDMLKLMNKGTDCQIFLSDSTRALLVASDIATRKCQNDIVPKPTTVESVTSSKCFGDVVSNIKAKVVELVEPTADCFKKADITVDQSVVQDILQVAENSIIESVKNIIRIGGPLENKNINLNVITSPNSNSNPNPTLNLSPTPNADDNEALDQVEAIFEALVPVISEKIDLEKLMNSGANCQSILANNMQDLIEQSNAACRKCQSDIIPAPTSVGAVTSTKCFGDVVTNINTKLTNIMYPIVDCWKRASIPIENSFAQKVLELAQKAVVLSVQNIIKLPKQPDVIKSFNTNVNMGSDQNEVSEQIQLVFQIVGPVFAEKIGMQKFMEKVVGSECQTLVLNTLESLLGASDDATRKCQASIIPAPTSVEYVTSTKCFGDVVVNIKANMSSLVKPADDCLKKIDINLEAGVVQQILAFTEDSVIKVVQNVIKIHG